MSEGRESRPPPAGRASRVSTRPAQRSTTTVFHGRRSDRWTAGGFIYGSALAALAVLTTWYGALDSEVEESHPGLKLAGAMALAGAGTVILLLAKPADQLLVSDHSEPHDHTALAALNPLRFGVALLSMSAALIHFAVIRQHLDEYWLYGAFFIVVAVAQMGWALLVVVQPSPLILVIGAVGNAFVVGTWIITRTVGSLVGPAATETAKAGFGDIVSTAFEVAIVIGAMLLWRSTRFDRPIEPDRGEVVNAAVAISVTLLTVLCLYSAVGGSPFVSHVG